MDKSELVQKLVEMEGTPLNELIVNATYDSVAKGICTKCADYSTDIEPDSDDGMCEECGTATVASVLVLCEMV